MIVRKCVDTARWSVRVTENVAVVGGSMAPVERADHAGGDAAPLRHVIAVLHRPRADRLVLLPTGPAYRRADAGPGSAATGGRSATRAVAGCDVRAKRLPQLSGILVRQI